MARLRVRARAVDMLGRQQIAGIPTAIHELFKNAHDAYAERVEVDYFRRTRVLILRDDGYGMTRQDVESRWLTLGTESRLGANRPDRITDWTGPKCLPRRAVMGEKGIGRLAIGVIAPITLLLTRAARPEGLHDLVVALVHWGLFEQPGLDIGAIDIPIVEFPGGTLPTRGEVRALIRTVRKNIEDLDSEISDSARRRLIEEIEAAAGIAPDRLDAMLRELSHSDETPLSLGDDGYGTHFILLPTVPELNDDIDGGSDKDASILEKNLLGFSNTMTGSVPVIRTEFRDHHLDATPTELIGPYNFFLPKEFEKADHRITGEVDERGQFRGLVQIYGGEPTPFVCNWTAGAGRAGKCGAFSLDFAYVMGRKNETRLSPEDWVTLGQKVDRVGGLYIYRDGIRILPYGNSDFDFLDIELRRTKSAQDWFFSYRRIFGYVAISHAENHFLSEKAGREGFRHNQAYRDFRAILMNLFQRLAFEFFRESATQGEPYWEQKEILKTQDKLLAKQQKKANNRRKEFKDELERFFAIYEAGGFEEAAGSILRDADMKTLALAELPDNGDLAVGVRELQREISARVARLESDNTITKPRGLAITKRFERDWAAYQRMSAEIRERVTEPLRRHVDALIRSRTLERINDSQRRETALTLLHERRDALARELSDLRSSVYGTSKEMLRTLKEVVREEFAEFRRATETLLEEFVRETAGKPEHVDELRASSEQRIHSIRQQEKTLLDAIQRQLQDFSEALRARETSADQIGALEQKAERLEEQLEFYAEFAQVGMSVGILQHEFERAATGLRVAVRDLAPWAKGTPALDGVYRRLRDSFEHLDGYLSVLDPLGRRLRRTRVALSGDEIRLHLNRVFSLALEENGITLKASDAFLSKQVECFSSAVLGAFINVMDNAIYWVSNGAVGERTIELDADEKGFLISNTGPGIEERHRESIFEFGETTKPGGRGMGLAISRGNLRREDLDLELIRAGSGVGPVFRIATVRPDGDEGDDHDE